jgi:hypothetical protein
VTISRLSVLGVILGLAALHITCHQALFVAPAGSTLSLVANPTFIPANTGVSVITAIVYDGTGFPVADGTVVQFFTSLGRIDEQGRTNDGVARVNLYADSRSGQAKVTAISGTGEVAPGGNPSGSPPPSPTPTPSGGGLVAPQVKSVTAVGAVSAAASIDVFIGGAIPASGFITANPQRITNPRFSTIAVYVFDGDGNPVANVPVFFDMVLPTDGTILQETLDSAGSPRFTDNNGRATDILRTSYDPAEMPKTVEVRFTVPAGPTGTVTVAIN